MPEAVTFGRRQARAARPPPAAASPRRAPDPSQLSAAAEAFRAELAADRSSPRNDFAAWRRSSRWRQALMLAATIGSFVPGGASLLMDMPLPVSVALGAAAMAGNVWLRRERFRRRREILAWEQGADES